MKSTLSNLQKQINKNLRALNKSTYFLAFIMLFLNIASRYLNINIGYTVQHIMAYETVKFITVLTIVYTTTRDLVLSTIIACCFLFIVEYLLHEESKLCIIPEKFRTYKPKEKEHDRGTKFDITEKELNNAISILMKVKTNSDCMISGS